jgi:hypothetical protein
VTRLSRIAALQSSPASKPVFALQAGEQSIEARLVLDIGFLHGDNSLWALLIIVMDLFVIWAVMVHGRELLRERPPL